VHNQINENSRIRGVRTETRKSYRILFESHYRKERFEDICLNMSMVLKCILKISLLTCEIKIKKTKSGEVIYSIPYTCETFIDTRNKVFSDKTYLKKDLVMKSQKCISTEHLLSKLAYINF
jgi:hypothetical protein